MSKITQTDLELAKAYFPILVDIAKSNQLISYSDLVSLAKKNYPQNDMVQSAIPVSTGRRLDVVRMFTQQSNCPDLTSLVISKGTGECGVGFLRSFNPEAVREKVQSFDWSKVKTDFDGFVEITHKKIKPRKRVKKEEAAKIMYGYYQSHLESMPKTIKDYREYIIESISEGIDVNEAFEECIARINIEVG